MAWYIQNLSKSLSNVSLNEKISIKRNSSCCFRDEYKKNTSQISLVSFNKILSVNTNEKYVVVEPGVSMEQITDFLLNLKAGSHMLPVTPEFKHITVGGAVNGLGIESSSCKYGLFEKTVLKYEVILTSGELIEATPDNKHSDLFYALPGSYGTLGIVTKVYIKIIPTEKYVKVKYSMLKNTKEIESQFKKQIENENVEFMEGIVLQNKTVLSIAEPVKISYYDWFFNTSCFKYFFSKWYYNHLKDISDNNTEYSEFISLKDYLFRWDRGAFWFASNRLKCNLWNRLMYGSQLTSKKLYERAKQKNIYEREKHKIVQDLLIPLDNMCKFIKETTEISKVYPIWLCPIKTFKDSKTIFSLPNNGKIYVDVGVYGGWTNKFENDFLIKNKEIEILLHQNGGIKFLCNMNYYDKDFFWEIYDKNEYLKIKTKYDKKNNLLNIHDKVCSFYITHFHTFYNYF